jgi:hypothetical protein
MHRLTVIGSVICCALFAGACGSSSTGPKDVFSGHWVGLIYNTSTSIAVDANPTQNGSTIGGTTILSVGSQNVTAPLTGTSTPPSLNVVVIVPPGTSGDTLTFIGTYITADSVFGKVIESGDSVAVAGLKKQ